MAGWETYLEGRRDQSLEELRELARIPSISSLPEHRDDVYRAAEWAADRLRTAGLEHVEIMPTGGHPVVYGDWLHAEGKPTILIYGHFDVQPVDPIELWETGPFAAEIRDGRIYARGIADMKGTMFVSILAVEALLKTAGRLAVNVKFILEGQEEIGSPQLPDFVAAHRDLLACDLVVSGDGGQWSEDEPEIGIGLKGGCGVQIDVHGANTDLHSGLYGGGVHNPIHALVRILDSVRSPEGRILVDGFFDDVVPLSEEDRAAIAAPPFDEEEYKASLGVNALFGDPDYTPRERLWARPTLEVNGIWGGFQGEGVKTVIPNEAHAKITSRLVPNQEPERVVRLITEHVKRHTPPGVTADVVPLAFRARPYLVPPDQWGNRILTRVLAGEYGKEPYLTRSGGSVPVCETFLTELGAYTVGCGFALPDERFHAPNEFWRLSSFERGQRVWPRLLQALGEHQS